MMELEAFQNRLGGVLLDEEREQTWRPCPARWQCGMHTRQEGECRKASSSANRDCLLCSPITCLTVRRSSWSSERVPTQHLLLGLLTRRHALQPSRVHEQQRRGICSVLLCVGARSRDLGACHRLSADHVLELSQTRGHHQRGVGTRTPRGLGGE